MSTPLILASFTRSIVISFKQTVLKLSYRMSSSEAEVTNKTDSGTFLYFSYGSNLNSKRIHVNNPSAKRIGAGLLKNYRLDFNRFSERWNGAVATVVPDESENVWGAVWEIDSKDMENLDKQEGVERQIYHVFHPTIHVLSDKTQSLSNSTSLSSMTDTLVCRCYHLSDEQMNSTDTRPSVTYLNVVIEGAIESGLPLDYVSRLKSIEHNGKEVEFTSQRKVYL